MLRGEQDGSLQVHQRSYADRWLCRVVLPMDWVEGGIVEMGFVRGHGDADEIEMIPMGGSRGTEIEIGTVGLDLTKWEE
jgi:hypothetical protein